jgi:tetratricopeptide (TPR) repeat protein/pimeloyl-ACP methyl ester carboxylesterase
MSHQNQRRVASKKCGSDREISATGPNSRMVSSVMSEPSGHWLRRPATSAAAVVFVHGILSNSESCWRTGDVYWPDLLASEESLTGIGIYVFSYRSDAFAANYSLGDAVEALNAYLTLDKLLELKWIIFVCHSMGGIVARQLIVTRQMLFKGKGIRIGLFLVASPSLGSDYASLLSALARAVGNSQAEALRFADNNTWLNDLDRNFINLKESGQLFISGQELVEDEFVVLRGILKRQVVRPFSGARYFGDSLKIPKSDHFTIAKPSSRTSLQHRQLVQFISNLLSSGTTQAPSEATSGTDVEKYRSDLSHRPIQVHFFISRSVKDEKSASWIAETLEGAGYSTIVQDFEFRPGHSFFHQINDAAGKADHFIAVLSPDYLDRPFTLSELYAGISNDPPSRRRLVIPVLVRQSILPEAFADVGYIDIAGVPPQDARRTLLDGIQQRLSALTAFLPASVSEPYKRSSAYKTRVNNLPSVDSALYGRDREMASLDDAWTRGNANVLQIVASGGTGKTALVDRWFRRHINEANIFAWSFYMQGTKDVHHMSSDDFFLEMLAFFGIAVEPTTSIYTKVGLLADAMQRERVLLLLDGIEPLQDGQGNLQDQALKTLLQQLATVNAGLVVCTTRIFIRDIGASPPRTRSLSLDNLSAEDGISYLKHLGVKGDDAELSLASSEYGNHALALTLLGTYLTDFYRGDVSCRHEIPALMVDDVKSGRHARRIMQAYARMLEGSPEAHVLWGLGFFDRPAEVPALRLLLPDVAEMEFRGAIKRLEQARLILPPAASESSEDGRLIDCHPLIREYFSEVARVSNEDTFRKGHERLFRYFMEQAPLNPKLRSDLLPLFSAVYHGCNAGMHLEAFRSVYVHRITLGDEFYLTDTWGEFGTDLSVLANFFKTPWVVVVPQLPVEEAQRAILHSNFALRGIGRIRDAVDQMRTLGRTGLTPKLWSRGRVRYSNLSQLLLMLGQIQDAIGVGRKALELSAVSSDYVAHMSDLVDLADALHQAGYFDDARELFVRAEQIQFSFEPGFPILYSVPGYRYCDLLLSLGEETEVQSRARKNLSWAELGGRALDIGLACLSLGRTVAGNAEGAAAFLERAVDQLRTAGSLVHFPRALVARAIDDDLEQARRLAERCGLNLCLADCYLFEAAKQAAAGDHKGARNCLDNFDSLALHFGYRRYDRWRTELNAQIQAIS